MGNYPTTNQTFFPDRAIMEREDAAFDESMQFIRQECIDNSDDESAEKPDETTATATATAPKRKRAKKQPILEYSDEHGVRKELPPERTNWYLSYVGCDLCRTDRRKAKKFRRRFRLPYDKYLELLQKVKANTIFESHMGTSGKNQTKAKPIELLVLGSLRYLGQGWTFDDLEENTGLVKRRSAGSSTSLLSLAALYHMMSLSSHPVRVTHIIPRLTSMNSIKQDVTEQLDLQMPSM
jgi:hypothetical protein